MSSVAALIFAAKTSSEIIDIINNHDMSEIFHTDILATHMAKHIFSVFEPDEYRDLVRDVVELDIPVFIKRLLVWHCAYSTNLLTNSTIKILMAFNEKYGLNYLKYDCSIASILLMLFTNDPKLNDLKYSYSMSMLYDIFKLNSKYADEKYSLLINILLNYLVNHKEDKRIRMDYKFYKLIPKHITNITLLTDDLASILRSEEDIKTILPLLNKIQCYSLSLDMYYHFSAILKEHSISVSVSHMDDDSEYKNVIYQDIFCNEARLVFQYIKIYHQVLGQYMRNNNLRKYEKYKSIDYLKNKSLVEPNLFQRNTEKDFNHYIRLVIIILFLHSEHKGFFFSNPDTILNTLADEVIEF